MKPLITVCAWCSKEKKEAIYKANPGALFTHTICKQCKAKILKEHK